MKMNITLALISSAALLAGCQSNGVSTSEKTVFKCMSGNYNNLGYEVGTSGLSVREFNRYTAECGEQLPAHAKKDYIAGFRKGIAEYCNYDNGLKLGQEGIADSSVCPLELREGFQLGLNQGLAEKRVQDHYKKELEREERRKLTIESQAGMGASGGGPGGG
ncbi:DUF2799 domain-containing protein [Catenovulum sp. SM1970]|uniref:DUF2799 domain-containing protein n=1 Tax=Marinifaba aquimaris TaxID=2741323 RepID=UPI001572C3B6|nr:DUF2799 domain-containing protein [Marinifaba aquimaris]NTS76675.1 DUF2799 domain-containing protein [Marinifaba aquimaris]